MGSFFSSLWDSLTGQRTYKVIIVGLNNAGKTTLVYALQLNKFVETNPTIGGTPEEITYKNMKFLAWDLGGQEQLRESWSLYYQSTDAVIFVVDSSEPQRFPIARKELHKILAAEELVDACILVFANKQDIPSSMSTAEVATALELGAVNDRSWTLQGCSAVTSQGLNEGMNWLVSKLKGRP
eukprot:Tbor_TRINITY_DN6162_c0_g4::TRINITY_DN6162_c0_g4_i1::g.22432::m.22432